MKLLFAKEKQRFTAHYRAACVKKQEVPTTKLHEMRSKTHIHLWINKNIERLWEIPTCLDGIIMYRRKIQEIRDFVWLPREGWGYVSMPEPMKVNAEWSHTHPGSADCPRDLSQLLAEAKNECFPLSSACFEGQKMFPKCIFSSAFSCVIWT